MSDQPPAIGFYSERAPVLNSFDPQDHASRQEFGAKNEKAARLADSKTPEGVFEGANFMNVLYQIRVGPTRNVQEGYSSVGDKQRSSQIGGERSSQTALVGPEMKQRNSAQPVKTIRISTVQSMSSFKETVEDVRKNALKQDYLKMMGLTQHKSPCSQAQRLPRVRQQASATSKGSVSS